MCEAAGQRHLYDLGAIGSGIIEYCFESGVRRDKLAILRSGKRFRAQFENLAGTVAQQDLIAIDMV